MADVNISKYRASVVREGSKPATPGFVVSEGQDPVNPPGTNNFVPYSGATSNVELGEFGVEAGFVTLDTTPTNTPTDQGTIFWDADDETVDVVLNGYTMKIGEDLFYPVKNQTGSTIAKGVAVRFNGTVGASGRLLIAPFIADGSVPSSRFMGVTAEEILNGEDGKVLYFGRVRGINTDAFNEGDILYASTTVAGGYQTAIPLPPNNIVQIAAVVTKSATVGTIFVRPTLGSNINADEGVKITSVADKNLLQYQSATSLWENKTLAQVIGSDYVPSTRNITINGTTQDLSADRTYNVGTVTSVGLSSATSGVTIGGSPVTTSGTITLAIATASGSQNGLLSSTDWTTFNNKQNALTNPVTGTGTTNYLPKFTGTSTIANSQIFDNGTNVGIGTNTPSSGLELASGLDLKIPSNGNIIFGNSNILIYKTSGQDGLSFNTGGSVKMQLTSSGNVLIGTTTDNGARFQVSGRSTVTDSVGGNTIMEISNTNTTNGFGLYVRGGVGSTSYAFNVVNAANTVDLFKVMGSGAATFSSSVGVGAGMTIGTSGTNNISWNTAGGIRLSRTNVGPEDTLTQRWTGSLAYVDIAASTQWNGGVTILPNGGGSVGIGTATPNTILHTFGTSTTIYDSAAVGGQNTSATLRIQNNSNAANTFAAIDFNTNANRVVNRIVSGHESSTTSGFLAFVTESGAVPAERMRITSSGNVLIGTTTDSGYKLNVAGTAIISSTVLICTTDSNNYEDGFRIKPNGSGSGTLTEAYNNGGGTALIVGRGGSNGTAVDFRRGSTQVGSISVTTTATAYNTSSDYRLKTDFQDYNGLDLVSKIKTYYFKWKTDKTRSFGVIAHELQDVINYAVNGEKDGETMQGVDYSKLVPIMVKAIQELKQEIDTLKN